MLYKNTSLTYTSYRYFLAAGTASRGIFGGSPKTSTASAQSSQQDTQAKIKELAEKRKAAAEASQRQAEERRAAAAEAAEAKRREAEERRIAQQEAAAARQRDAEEKRQAAAVAAKERKAATAAAEAKRQAQAKKAETAVSKAKPRQTISLGFLNFGGSESDSSSPPKTSSSAPFGVPTISRWRQNRDKSITGLISGKFFSFIFHSLCCFCTPDLTIVIYF